MNTVVWRRVVRNGVSPMNPKVKWSQLECGHDIFGPRRVRVGVIRACHECGRKLETDLSYCACGAKVGHVHSCFFTRSEDRR
jgi:hypothetical protein